MKFREESRREDRSMDTDLPPYELGSGEGETLWFFGTLVTIKAAAGQTGGRFALVE